MDKENVSLGVKTGSCDYELGPGNPHFPLLPYVKNTGDS